MTGMLFLVGARRSGTNWLERMLTAHPEIVAMPSETYLFSSGVDKLNDLVQHSNPADRTPGQTFVDRDRFITSLRALLDEIFAANVERKGGDPRYLLERTPWHATQLPLIAAVYPDARVLHIVRDGRAVTRSLLSMHWGPETMESAAAEWRDCVRGGRQGEELFGENYMEVRYEELLDDPLGGVRGMLDWLAAPYDESVLKLIATEAHARFNVDPASSELRADKWREELSRGDLAEFDRVAGAELAKLGYKPDTAAGESDRGPSSFRAPLRFRPVHARGALRARRTAADLKRNLEVSRRFFELLCAGEHAEARRMCAADAFFSLVGRDERVAGRGDPQFSAVAEALARDRALECSPAEASLHPGGGQFTTVGTYELEDGSQWARTLVLDTRVGVVHGAALYRFELAR